MKGHWGRRIGGRRPRGVAGEIPLLRSFFHLSGEAGSGASASRFLALKRAPRQVLGARDPLRRQRQAGSLTGAVHLSKGNAGVPRRAQRGRKPLVEQKGKSSLDFDFQYEYEPRKRGLSILSTFGSFEREVSEKLPQG